MVNHLKEDIDLLMHEYRDGRITIHQLMRLIDMIYKDYLDRHPEEIPDHYESCPEYRPQ